MTLPALTGCVRLPQLAQKPCRARQCISPRACARIAASPAGSRPAVARRSAKTPTDSAITLAGSSAADKSTANSGRLAWMPRKAQAPPVSRSTAPVPPASSTASGWSSATHRIRLWLRQTGAHSDAGSASAAVQPRRVRAAVRGAVERAAGIGIGARGEDVGHGGRANLPRRRRGGKPCGRDRARLILTRLVKEATMGMVNIYEAKTNLSRLVEQAAAARRSSSPRPASRWPGWCRWRQNARAAQGRQV